MKRSNCHLPTNSWEKFENEADSILKNYLYDCPKILSKKENKNEMPKQ